MTDEPVVRASLTYEGFKLIHNDLSNAAHHLKARVEEAVKRDDRKGIGLDMMAVVTMTAFSFEAYLNFIGSKVIKDFVERQGGDKKRKAIMEALGIKWNGAQRPFSTVEKLIQVRDVMAHGKPVVFKGNEEAIGTHSQLEETLYSYRKGYEVPITYDFMCDAYDDVQSLWRMMLEAGKIDVFETLDRGSSTISFKEYVEA